jgi:hypothetical protein
LIAVTVSEKKVVCERPPDVPVSVIVEVARFEESSAVSVNLLALSVLVGLNEAVTPRGSPETFRLTPALKLPRRAMVIAVVALLPWGTERLAVGVRIVESPAPAGGGANTS